MIAKLAQQRAAKIVVVDLDQVARRGAEPLAPFAHLARGACSHIARPFQLALDLQRCDPGLMIGKPPDASDRLEQADKEQIRNLRMHHGQIQRRRIGEIRSHDRIIEERITDAIARPPNDGVECIG